MSVKTKRFSKLLASPETVFAMEAHNGLSAKIVEEAGFPLIWASGLSISAALGLRDRNEASWTQVLEILEFMSDATTIPILVDGDTGYGDFNNFRRLVHKLCQRSIAAVCIEDKVFPKSNSFSNGKQILADIDEFCGKIKAGKDSQLDDDFRIIARTETLIVGQSLSEALRRAAAYHDAGADGILIHSRKTTAEEVLRFAAEWDNRAPVIIVPTKYYATPTSFFREAGVSIVIWANHNLRASLSAMREITHQIFAEESLVDVEGRIGSLGDLFRIVGNDEIVEAELRYLPNRRKETKAIILAASRGGQLQDLTLEKPKCMLDIRGEPILSRLDRSLRTAGIRDITVVGGYRPETITLPDIRHVQNDGYETTGEVVSLSCALEQLMGDCIVCYGDILFRDFILDLLLRAEGDIVTTVDNKYCLRSTPPPSRHADWVVCNVPFTGDPLDERPVLAREAYRGLPSNEVSGEFIGLVKLTSTGAALVRAEIETMLRDGSAQHAHLVDLFNRLLQKGMPVHVLYVTGHWLDINDAFDLADARNFI